MKLDHTFDSAASAENEVLDIQVEHFIRIQMLFDDALKHQSANLNPNKKKFLNAVATLKQDILSNFNEHDAKFNFTNCFSLAERVHNLTNDIMHNKATKAQLEQFKKDNAVFNGPSKASKVLCAILATIASIATGIIYGFLIAGPVGALAGGVVAGALGATGFGLFAARKTSAEKVAHEAGKTLANSDTSPVQCCDVEQDVTMPGHSSCN